MAFGINGPSGPGKIPQIQKSHHTNDGGAGNLGYFQRGKNDDDEKKKKEETDSVSFSGEKEEKDEFIRESETAADNIGTKIRKMWLKLNGLLGN